jgi:hypothetical protein
MSDRSHDGPSPDGKTSLRDPAPSAHSCSGTAGRRTPPLLMRQAVGHRRQGSPTSTLESRLQHLRCAHTAMFPQFCSKASSRDGFQCLRVDIETSGARRKTLQKFRPRARPSSNSLQPGRHLAGRKTYKERRPEGLTQSRSVLAKAAVEAPRDLRNRVGVRLPAPRSVPECLCVRLP